VRLRQEVQALPRQIRLDVFEFVEENPCYSREQLGRAAGEGMRAFDASPANFAETFALASVLAGEWAEFARESATTLRADFLCHLLLGLPAPEPNDDGTIWPKGPLAIRVRNARIEGKLDLTDATGPDGTSLPPLLFECCEFPEPIDLSYVRLSRLSLKDCRITHLSARGIRIDGPFDFSGVYGIKNDKHENDTGVAWIDAHGARIGGDIEGAGARLRTPLARPKEQIPNLSECYALDLSNCDIRGRVRLMPDFEAQGGITFSGGNIDGEVWLNGSKLQAAEGAALKADATRFGSALVLNSVSASGGVSLYGAHIGLIFIAENASFDKGIDRANGLALNASTAKIGQNIILNRIKAKGTLGLRAVQVGGNIFCQDADFAKVTESEVAIDAATMSVTGSVGFWGKQFKAAGEIILAGSKIGGTLEFSDGTFSNRTANGLGRAIFADNIVAGGINLKRIRAEGQVSLIDAEIGGDLQCDNGTFMNRTEDGRGMAIVADNVSIAGTAYLRGDNFRAEGRVVLRLARISGALECDNATFSNRTEDGDGLALEAEGIDTKIVRLCGSKFIADGQISLLGADISGNLTCEDANFHNFGKVAILADRARVGGAVYFDRAQAMGGISCINAKIAMHFYCVSAIFSNEGGKALLLEGADIGGAVILRGTEGEWVKSPETNIGGTWREGRRFEAFGEVNLFGMKIGHELECMNANFRNPKGAAINARNAIIRGAMKLSGSVSQGEVALDGATVGSDIECGNAILSNPTGGTITARNAAIRGSMKLSQSISFGEIGLNEAKIDSNLEIADAKLVAGGSRSSLAGQNLKVNGSIVVQGAEVMGKLDFSHLRVGEAVKIAGMAFPSTTDLIGESVRAAGTQELIMEHARVGAEFRTERLSSSVELLIIDLRNAHVHTLDDGVGDSEKHELSGWGGLAARQGRVQLSLDGFTYDRLEGCKPTPPKMRWLERLIRAFGIIRKSCRELWRVAVMLTSRFESLASRSLGKKPVQFMSAKPYGRTDNAWQQGHSTGHEQGILAGLLRDRYSPEPRLEWLTLQKRGEFFPQPYRHLAKVLRAQGHESAAREVAIVERDLAPAGFWYSRIKRLFRWGFGYGLHPLRALCSLGICVLVGWAVIAGARSSGALILTTTPVIPIASTGSLMSPVAPAEIQCGNEIVPIFYAIDLMLPVIPLHQETKCDISAKPEFLGWQSAKFIFSILGKLVTTLALITFSGVLKTRPEE
jgi:hypothetical protein